MGQHDQLQLCNMRDEDHDQNILETWPKTFSDYWHKPKLYTKLMC